MRNATFLVAALLLGTAGARAAPPRQMIEIKAGDAFNLRADRGYLLFRTYRPAGVLALDPIFMRVPSEADLMRFREAKRAAFTKALPQLQREHERQMAKRTGAASDGSQMHSEPSLDEFDFDYQDISNLESVRRGKALVAGSPESIYLVEVIPGDFVLYGFVPSIFRPLLAVCMCLGTVGFRAPAGIVTDLGTILSDGAKESSSIDELKAESNFGPSSDVAPSVLITATVRPPAAETQPPQALRNAPVRPANYHAIGKFLDPRTLGINRLVPVPGVLSYDGGRVIDVQTGAVVPDRF